MKRTRLIGIASVGVVAALAAAGLWMRANSASSDARPVTRREAPIPVETAPVQRHALRDVRSFSGTLRANAQFDVAPKVGGRLQRLLVDLGDPVRNGQVVAQLDDEEHQQQVQQVRAELGVAQAGLSEARSLLTIKQAQLARLEQLHQRRIASDAELEAAQVDATAQRARVQVTRAQVTQREAALRGAEVRLSYTVIRATWHDGADVRHVGERHTSEGALLAANQPIVSIVETQSLTAVAFAAERDYPALRVGQAAAVKAEAFPQRSFTGRIARLAPVFRESTRQARVEVELENPERLLKPGMFAAVEVQVGLARDAPSVPAEALVTRDAKRGVFLVDSDGRHVRFVPVRTGISDGGLLQVLEPPLEGRVATLGNHLLSDGAAIVLADAAGGRRGSRAEGGGKLGAGENGPRPDTGGSRP